MPALSKRVKSDYMKATGKPAHWPASAVRGTREKSPALADIWAYSPAREPVKIPSLIQSNMAACRSRRAVESDRDVEAARDSIILNISAEYGSRFAPGCFHVRRDSRTSAMNGWSLSRCGSFRGTSMCSVELSQWAAADR